MYSYQARVGGPLPDPTLPPPVYAAIPAAPTTEGEDENEDEVVN
jgi:hypothetical protein